MWMILSLNLLQVTVSQVQQNSYNSHSDRSLSIILTSLSPFGLVTIE